MSNYHTRYRQLLPSTDAALPSALPNSSLQKLYKRRRVSTQTACNECRRRKTRCDGGHPSCEVYRQRSIQCIYVDKRTQEPSAPAEPNEILEILKSAPESEAFNTFCILRANHDPSIIISKLRGFAKGDSSREGIIKRFEEDVNSNTSPSEIVTPRTSPAESAITLPEEAVGVPCFGQLLPWRTCPIFSNRHLHAETSERSTTLSLPPLPIDSYTYYAHMDTWTRTGWTKAHIRHLFDVLITWDYLPFCLLCKELFLQDFYSGSDLFCSSALVHAILALATRLVNESDVDKGVLPSGWLGSTFFFDEAESIVRGKGPFSSLPDTQALGILSLYHLRCGREVQAQRLAESFVTSITELCQREPLLGREEGSYARARATTYCGAVSLARILFLTTGQLFNVCKATTQENTLFLDLLSHCSGGNSHGDDRLRPHLAVNAHSSLQWNLQLLPTRIFQLTDWVHTLLITAGSNIQEALENIREVYHKCLDWYDSFSAFLGAESSRTPFIQFVHMYYHFCLLCIFRPFIGLTIEGSIIQPHKMCTQASQSILVLVQSYDDLFTVRRVSGFIPYFVCTSGLFSLAVQDRKSPTNLAHLRPGDATSIRVIARPQEHEAAASQCGPLHLPAYVEISAATYAHLLLTKMGLTHPAARIAEKLVLEEIKCILAEEAAR